MNRVRVQPVSIAPGNAAMSALGQKLTSLKTAEEHFAAGCQHSHREFLGSRNERVLEEPLRTPYGQGWGQAAPLLALKFEATD